MTQFEYYLLSMLEPPVMQSGLIKRLISIEDIVNLVVDEYRRKEATIKRTIGRNEK